MPYPRGTGDDPSAAAASRSAVIDAALEVVDDRGHADLTVRRIAAAAHFSASAVAYHVTPMSRFLSQLWVELHRRAAVSVIRAAQEPRDPTDQSTTWTLRAAADWLLWAEDHPNLARFYVEFTANPDDVELTGRRAGLPAEVWEHAHADLESKWWYFVRQSQAALELALRTPLNEQRVEVLADDLARVVTDWRAFVAEVLDRSR